MTQEERNKVYEGFTMVDVMAKNIIREAEGLAKHVKDGGGVSRTVFYDAMNKIIKYATDMEHRKQAYFTWLDEMKKTHLTEWIWPLGYALLGTPHMVARPIR